METNIGKPILALTTTILPRIARIFRSEDKGEGGKRLRAVGAGLTPGQVEYFPCTPLIGYYIADYHFQPFTGVKIL